MRFCVVGGMNLDVTGHCPKGFIMNDSNPGEIRFSAGGVGHNIALALKREGHEVSLLTTLSRDMFGGFLAEKCLSDALDISLSIKTPYPSPCYMSAHGADGDMVLAINDMPALGELSAEVIGQRKAQINCFDAVITEANLEEGALNALAQSVTKPLIADGVSVNKCGRLSAILPYLSAIKLNKIEAAALSGESSPRDAGQTLLRRGVKTVLISLGADGAYACDKHGDAFLSPERTYACQTTGAGDAMCAGLAIGCAMGMSAIKSAAMGMDAAGRLLASRVRQ